jgi:hypothetical protein
VKPALIALTFLAIVVLPWPVLCAVDWLAGRLSRR